MESIRTKSNTDVSRVSKVESHPITTHRHISDQILVAPDTPPEVVPEAVIGSVMQACLPNGSIITCTF